jgi:hypothetical protein
MVLSTLLLFAKGGQVFGPSGGHRRLIHRDNGAVGVSHKAVEAGGGIASCVDCFPTRSVSEQMLSPGGRYRWLINRDNSAIGMGHKAIEAGGGIAGGVAGRRSCSVADGRCCRVDTAINSVMSSKMLGPGGRNSRLIYRDNSAIRVGHKPVEAGGGIASRVDSSVSNAMSGQMLGPGRNNCRLIGGHNSAVGMGHEGGEVQGAGIRSEVSIIGKCQRQLLSVEGTSGSVVVIASGVGGADRQAQATKFGGQMFGLRGRHDGLVQWGDGPVGVALQAEKALAGSDGHDGGENLQIVIIFIKTIIRIYYDKGRVSLYMYE